MNHGKTCRITKAIDETSECKSLLSLLILIESRSSLATGTIPKLPGNNPVVSSGVAIPQADTGALPALIEPIFAYEGEKPTTTGKAQFASSTTAPGKPVATTSTTPSKPGPTSNTTPVHITPTKAAPPQVQIPTIPVVSIPTYVTQPIVTPTGAPSKGKRCKVDAPRKEQELRERQLSADRLLKVRRGHHSHQQQLHNGRGGFQQH